MDKKNDIAIAYAAKRRAVKAKPMGPIAPVTDTPAEQSIVSAIMAKRAPKPIEEPLDLDMESDLVLDTPDLLAFEEPSELPSTGNSLADKIRARMAKR